MNKTLLLAGGSTLAFGALVLTGGSAFAASQNWAGNGDGNQNGARSGYTQQIEAKATALKLTTAQLQEELSTKTLAQVAAEKNVSLESIHAVTRTAAEANWVAKGLTADQIKDRAASMAERQADCDGTGSGDGAGQMHRGRN